MLHRKGVSHDRRPLLVFLRNQLVARLLKENQVCRYVNDWLFQAFVCFPTISSGFQILHYLRPWLQKFRYSGQWRSSGDRSPFLLELLQMSGMDRAQNKFYRKNESFGKDSAMIPWLNERPPIQMNRCSSMAQRAIRPDGREGRPHI